MGRPSNREIERYYFEQFRGHDQVPEGELEYGDKPDVLERPASSKLRLLPAAAHVKLQGLPHLSSKFEP